MRSLHTPFLGTLSLFLICLLSGFWGCGDTEEAMETGVVEPFNTEEAMETGVVEPFNTEEAMETEAVAPFNLLSPLIEQDEIASDGRELSMPPEEEIAAAELRAKHFREELSTGKRQIPLEWWTTEDLVLRVEYYRAQLIKQFGDIPQVHTVADHELKVAMGIPWVPREVFIAFLEAQYHLWPHPTTLQALENARNPPKPPDMKKLRTEDPGLWDKLNREHLINRHGDIPDVHLVADFQMTITLEQAFTEDEYLAYLEALTRLHPADDIPRLMVERYRKAKADGIPFGDVNVDDILAKIDDEEPEAEDE